jgi:uncharacterized protein YdaT
MEIKEIVSYYIHEKSRTLEVSFTLITDTEDEVRNDIISISEAEDFGYKLIQDDFDIFEEEDFEIEDDEFESVDEEILMSYLNEYYVVNPDRLPSPELF